MSKFINKVVQLNTYIQTTQEKYHHLTHPNMPSQLPLPDETLAAGLAHVRPYAFVRVLVLSQVTHVSVNSGV